MFFWFRGLFFLGSSSGLGGVCFGFCWWVFRLSLLVGWGFCGAWFGFLVGGVFFCCVVSCFFFSFFFSFFWGFFFFFFLLGFWLGVVILLGLSFVFGLCGFFFFVRPLDNVAEYPDLPFFSLFSLFFLLLYVREVLRLFQHRIGCFSVLSLTRRSITLYPFHLHVIVSDSGTFSFLC